MPLYFSQQHTGQRGTELKFLDLGPAHTHAFPYTAPLPSPPHLNPQSPVAALAARVQESRPVPTEAPGHRGGRRGVERERGVAAACGTRLCLWLIVGGGLYVWLRGTVR